MTDDRVEPLRGLGIAASEDLAIAAAVGRKAEALGYASVWVNDTPGRDGLSNAGAILRSSTIITAGVGALPCDRWSAEDISRRCDELGRDLGRLCLVVGAGRVPSPLGVVEETVSLLRGRFGTELTMGVAALGPRMCRLAGRIADVVLLNWSSPEHIEWSRRRIDEGAARRGGEGPAGSGPKVAAYVRMALGPRADEALAGEALRYSAAPHYARHFQKMRQLPGVALGTGEDAESLLRPYEIVLDETIVRAVPVSDDIEELLTLAEAAAPASARRE